MGYIICAIVGYIFGMINLPYFIGKLNSVDLRKKGCKTISTGNAFLLFGNVAGIICALFDFAKGYVAVLVTLKMFPLFPQAFATTLFFCIVGHIYPFYTDFNGGKGLSCLGGMILLYDWRVFVAMLAVSAVVIFATGYICYVSAAAAGVFAVVYAVMSHDFIGAAIILAASVLMVCKNLENFKRIKKGSELRVCYLWNKDSELERIKAADVEPSCKSEKEKDDE